MATTELRETSYRRIAQIVRRPEIQAAWRIETAAVPPMGERCHYLHCGAGLVLYILGPDRRTAHMHGALTPGDGCKAKSAFREHCTYLRALGVQRIRTRHRADHRRASLMCRVLGFERVAVPQDDGFKIYERCI